MVAVVAAAGHRLAAGRRHHQRDAGQL